MYEAKSGSASTYTKNKSILENAIAYGSVSGVDVKSENVGGILGEYGSGDISNVFAYNSYVGTAAAGTSGKALGHDKMDNPTSKLKTLSGIYQYSTILGDASVGYVDNFVTDEQITSKAFYQNKTTMDFGGAWYMEEGQHPTLTFAPPNPLLFCFGKMLYIFSCS